jgi:uncharacterized protein
VSGIRAERVTFDSEGDALVGTVFLPDTERVRGAVVVNGSWTTVKEQMAALYAAGIARRGFAALTFDFRGYGESSGTPRDYESPERKSLDLRNAADYFASHPAVDSLRIGLLGICAGGAYAALSAVDNPRIDSVALVAPWLHNAEIVEQLYGGAEGVRERRDRGAAALRNYEATGVVDYVPVVSTEDPSAAMYGSFDYYLNPSRGGIPQWGNRFAVMAWPGWLGFDPIKAAPSLTVPTLLVSGPDTAVPQGAVLFHDALPGAKELVSLPGNQFDFYDNDRSVIPALDAVERHFDRTL